MKDKVSPLQWVPSVYFAMGLPFIALNLVAVIMFDDLGVDKAQIAFWTSLLTSPTLLNSSGALCSRSTGPSATLS